jgi:uncharacterized membrane protein YbhN (UPF0104 family)
MKKSPRWSWLLSASLAAILLWFAVRGVDWKRVWNLIAAAHWLYLVLAAIMSSITYFLRSVRWRILLNAEANFTVAEVFSANMAGYVGNNFLPARAGELIRSFLISSRSPLSKTYVLTTAMAERMMDAVALVLWGSVVLLGVNPKPAWLRDVSWGTTAIAAAGVLAIFILPHTGNLCERIVHPKLLPLTHQILSGLRVFHAPSRLTAFLLWTIVIWCGDAFGVMIAARAFDLTLTFRMASLLLCGLGLGSAVAPTPGYVGTYQSVAVAVLTPFGISRDAALAFILVSQALGYVVVLILGLPSIFRRRVAIG